jgi:hypothetical protein
MHALGKEAREQWLRRRGCLRMRDAECIETELARGGGKLCPQRSPIVQKSRSA